MRLKDLDTIGAENLVNAIIRQAKTDYMHGKPDSELHKDAERFFKSKYFEVISGLDGHAVLRDLKEAYDKKHQKKRKGV